MRIIGGVNRGRPLTGPKSNNIRPSSDRFRESLFNILAHDENLPELTGARVIDVFAGTGALGLEALSRGGSFCLFVEQAAEARGLIRTNIETLETQGVTKLYRRDATNLGPIGTLETFDIAFLDPPYGRGLGELALSALVEGDWLKPSAIFVLEERKGSEIKLPNEFTSHINRTIGDTQLVIGRLQPHAGKQA